ncbi:uncharacterized protein LOC143693562 isoform X2 [Agelaius phoeniceus]|uniref:uncharacterized protein LOC143693562 isoform X2 n=1 Tax=Agelaius phoeniceus TaxID=39638 RepID=UPI004054EFD6
MSSHLFFLLIKIVLLRFMIAHRNGFHAYGDLPAPQYVLSNKSTTSDTLQKSLILIRYWQDKPSDPLLHSFITGVYQQDEHKILSPNKNQLLMKTEEYSIAAKGEFFCHPFLPHQADPDHGNCSGLLRPEFHLLTAKEKPETGEIIESWNH